MQQSEMDRLPLAVEIGQTAVLVLTRFPETMPGLPLIHTGLPLIHTVVLIPELSLCFGLLLRQGLRVWPKLTLNSAYSWVLGLQAGTATCSCLEDSITGEALKTCCL